MYVVVSCYVAKARKDSFQISRPPVNKASGDRREDSPQREVEAKGGPEGSDGGRTRVVAKKQGEEKENSRRDWARAVAQPVERGAAGAL
jgi:hypothetical protein